MKLRNLLNKKISYESIVEFMERVDTVLTYLVYGSAILLIVAHLHSIIK